MFQIDREIFDNSIWNNVAEFRVFFYILGNAVWKDEGVKKGNVLVGRGQYLRSYRNLREDLMYMDNNAIKYYSISHIKKIIDKLVVDGRVKKEETELGTLFTIVNYSKYQGFERFEKDNQERRENGARTEQEQNKNNKKKDNKVNKDNYIYIVEYLNLKAGTKYKADTKKTISLIDARLKEGFTLDDFKKVIDNKIATWKGTEWEKYLRPETLFGNKFEGYLNEKNSTKETEESLKGSNWRGSDKRL